jgi:flavin reductase (DIM6/NTAB) family NADH-FMN oxidoreductase RutF
MHVVSEPPILYLGTPVVLISTVNEDGSYNLAPMSSAFWLGWRCILGLASVSKTPQNMIRTGQCVLNLPSEQMVAEVNCLALMTGTDPVPAAKVARGYRYEKRKFEISGLTPVKSQTVAAPRVKECPVQLEAVVEHVKDLAENDDKVRGRTKVFEVRIQRVHVAEEILMDGHTDRIDPDKWRPLIMSFQRFYGLTPSQVHESTLGQVPEALYRSPDVDRARSVEPAEAD